MGEEKIDISQLSEEQKVELARQYLNRSKKEKAVLQLARKVNRRSKDITFHRNVVKLYDGEMTVEDFANKYSIPQEAVDRVNKMLE